MKSFILFLGFFCIACARQLDQVENVEVILKSKIGELIERLPKEAFLQILDDFEDFQG